MRRWSTCSAKRSAAAAALRAPFCIGMADQFGGLLRSSFPDVAVVSKAGQACFGSLDEWLHTEIRGSTLAEHVGYIPFESEAANLFFQLVSSRYQRASLIVTSNIGGAKCSATTSSPPNHCSID